MIFAASSSLFNLPSRKAVICRYPMESIGCMAIGSFPLHSIFVSSIQPLLSILAVRFAIRLSNSFLSIVSKTVKRFNVGVPNFSCLLKCSDGGLPVTV